MIELIPNNKSLSLGLLAMFVSSASFLEVSADTWKDIDTGYTWTYQINNDIAEIQSVSPKLSGACAIPSRLGGKPVTSIGGSAFYGCGGLTNITIPDSVTSIGSHAFYGCSGLASVIIPNGVKRIGDYAFTSCNGLTDVIIPDSVVYVGVSAFHGCSGLTNISVPDGVACIENYAFASCWHLLNITIGSGVTNIGHSAFSGCSALTNIVIPSSVMSIGVGAFWGCKNLVNVDIPDGITSIGANAFHDCSGLSRILIPTACFVDDSAIPSGIEIVRYKAIQTVSFNAANGMVSPEIMIVGYGAPYGDIPIPTRAGYSFDHWELDGVVINKDSIVSSLDDHTIVARWMPNRYSVTFDANGGDGGWSAMLDYDAVIAAPTVSKTGYAFIGWSPSVAATVPVDGATYTAQWTPNKHVVMFDANGGTGGTSATLDYDTAIVAPTVMRTGWTFKGWSPAVAATVPDENVTYTAQWEINRYAVTFDANGGEGGWSEILDYDASIVAPTVTRTGYAFIGWSPSVAATVPVDGATYTAQWTPNKHVVTFDANGGTGGTSATLDYDTAIVAPTVMRTGWTFKGWSPAVAATVPDENVTYTAQWEINRYAVTFDANGGEGGWSAMLDYDADIFVPIVTRAGYTFLGWSPSVAATVPVDGATYTAQWKAWVWDITVSSTSAKVKELYPDDYGRITNIVIAADVEALPDGFFEGCDALERLTFLSPDTELGDNDLRVVGKLYEKQPDGYWIAQGVLLGWKGSCPGTIPQIDTIRRVMDGALEGCTALTDLAFTVESVLTNIGDNAFARCTELRSLILPPRLEAIGDEAFMGCSYLANVIVPGSVRTVGARAFKNCTGFTAAQIEYGVRELGAEAFYGDWRISEVDIPSTVTNIGANAFGGDSSIIRIGLRGDIRKAKEIFSNYEHIKEATVKAGDGDIVDGLFSGFKLLQDVRFLGNCPSLGNDGRLLYDGTPETTGAVVTNGSVVVTNGLVTYVEKESTGWDGTPGSHSLPQAWPLVGSNRRSIAYWDMPTYLVRFDSNGGTLGVQDTYQHSEQFFALPPEPVQTGYSFAGWWTQPVGGLPVGKDTIFIEGVYTHLYAHWIKGHWVFLDPSGGTVANDYVTYVEQSVYGVLPVPVRSGYAFDGWTYNGYRVNPETEICENTDHTLVAQWEANLYSVRYNANGGAGEASEQGFVYGESKALRKNTFTYAGHMFLGWATNDTGEAIYADCEAVSNLTATAGGWIELYAVWTESDAFDFTLGTVTLNDLSEMRPIRFSNEWSGQIGVSTDAVAVVTLFKTTINETIVLTNAVGSGQIDWIPERADTYVLTHQVYESGAVVGNTLALTIIVPGPAVSISPADGTTFATSQTITISATDGAQIYYTTDGSEPTTSSTKYKRFRINGKTTLKAIAVVDGLPWSETAVARYALGIAANPVISPADGTVFGVSQEVSIQWNETDGVVRYTLDGSEPTAESSLYEGPFEIRNACTVRAKVFSDTLFDSATVDAEFCQDWTIGAALDCANLDFETSGAFGWIRDGDCMRSGGIGDGDESVLSAVVHVAGSISFKWRTSCEDDEYHEWDHVEFRVDGEPVLWLDGESGWQNETWEVAGGMHIIEWAYVKDEFESEGEDCAWLDEVVWTPAGAADQIPAVADDADAATVNAVVDDVGFVDVGVKAAIGGSAVEYAAFKTWAQGVKGFGSASGAVAGEAAVVANTNAAAAYSLGAERLFENAPKVEFGEVEVLHNSDISQPDCQIGVTVTVKDGEEAVKCVAEKVKEMFEATSDLGDWEGSAKLTPAVSVEAGEGATMRFKVTPGDGTAQRAFLRIRK